MLPNHLLVEFSRRGVRPFQARVRPDRVQPVRVSSTTGGGVPVGGTCVALPTNAAVVTVPTHCPVAGPLRSGTVPVPPLRPILLPDRSLPLVRPLGLGSRMPSPVCPITLASALHGHTDNLVSYLVHGFTFGFQIGCVGVPPPPTSVIRNLQSADTFSTVINRKLTKELVLGRILGPYDVMPNYPNYRIYHFGIVSHYGSRTCMGFCLG